MKRQVHTDTGAEGCETIVWQGETCLVIDAGPINGRPTIPTIEQLVVLLHSGERIFGILCDRIFPVYDTASDVGEFEVRPL